MGTKKTVKIKCEFCGVFVDVWDYRKKTARYCSRDCRYKGLSRNKRELKKELLSSGNKKCSLCKEIKQLSDFYHSNQKWDGLDTWCKKCKLLANKKYVKNPEVAERKRAFRKQYNLNTKEQRKFNRMKHLYGITFSEYNKLIEDQDNKCAICKNPLNYNRRAHIDHCHKKDQVRGILCYNCNAGLGHFKDSVHFLSNAIKYLYCHNEQHEREKVCEMAERIL